MPDTFTAQGITKTIGVAHQPLTGTFKEFVPEAEEDTSNWKLDSMWGAGPKQLPVLDTERAVEELVDRHGHR